MCDNRPRAHTQEKKTKKYTVHVHMMAETKSLKKSSSEIVFKFLRCIDKYLSPLNLMALKRVRIGTWLKRNV